MQRIKYILHLKILSKSSGWRFNSVREMLSTSDSNVEGEHSLCFYVSSLCLLPLTESSAYLLL